MAPIDYDDRRYDSQQLLSFEDHRQQLPPGFYGWSYAEQIDYLGWKLKRSGILAEIRARIGSDRESDRLDRDELSACLLWILENSYMRERDSTTRHGSTREGE